ncbi:MAG: 16S rRNA (guanine(527)-N(7))-methyltransferase RsmG, partial [Acidobacteriota bacterium]|nr:16S rRNA (guanine(527)-N(7))-methyltransferase RsmG [Acidobacteriota bacterium]
MSFENELARFLPFDIPNRDRLIEKSGRHLQLVAEANEHMNLTRISSPQEAAIKHVVDSVIPWKFFEGAKRVLDAGTGAGFPGIPLSIVLPDTDFVLADSTQKKARFVQSAIEALELDNVEAVGERAESLAVARKPTIITARAVAPIHRLIDLFGKALVQGSQLLLFKGPDVETEISEAGTHRFAAEILCRYE